MAKRLLKVNPGASAAEIAKQIHAAEKRRPRETFMSVGALLSGIRRKP